MTVIEGRRNPHGIWTYKLKDTKGRVFRNGEYVEEGALSGAT
jgi:hypothetical protein